MVRNVASLSSMQQRSNLPREWVGISLLSFLPRGSHSQGDVPWSQQCTRREECGNAGPNVDFSGAELMFVHSHFFSTLVPLLHFSQYELTPRSVITDDYVNVIFSALVQDLFFSISGWLPSPMLSSGSHQLIFKVNCNCRHNKRVIILNIIYAWNYSL